MEFLADQFFDVNDVNDTYETKCVSECINGINECVCAHLCLCRSSDSTDLNLKDPLLFFTEVKSITSERFRLWESSGL